MPQPPLGNLTVRRPPSISPAPSATLVCRREADLRFANRPAPPHAGEARANEQFSKPRLEPIGIAQPRERAPGLQERVLDRILRGVLVAQDHPRGRGQPPDRLCRELGKGVVIAFPRPEHKLAHCHRQVHRGRLPRCE